MKKDSTWKNRAVVFLPWVFLAAVFLFDVAYFWRTGLFGEKVLNADCSSEMVLASLWNKAGGFLFVPDWIYSTEVRFLITPVMFYRIGLALFSNWHLARTFAIALMLPLLAASYIFMMHGCGMRASAVWAAALLLCPLGADYSYVIVFGSYYLFYVVCAFLSVGLLMRLLTEQKPKRQILYLVLLLLIAFVSAAGGMRAIIICYLPLGVAAVCLFWQWFCRAEQKELRDCRSVWQVRGLAAACAAGAAALCGYLFNAKLLPRWVTFDNYNETTIQNFQITDILQRFNDILGIFGFRGNVKALSADGMLSAAALALTALFALSFWYCWRNRRSLSSAQIMLVVFAAASIVCSAVINTLTGQTIVRYMLPSAVFLIPVWHIAWQKKPFRNPLAKRTFAVAAAVCMLISFVPLAKHFVHPPEKTDSEQAAEWLVEEGYTQGYATFWNGNTLTENSNGKLEVWALCDSGYASGTQGGWQALEVYRYLQDKSHLSTQPSGKVFLLLSMDEVTQEPPFAQAERQMYAQGNLVIYGYDSVQELYDTLNT